VGPTSRSSLEAQNGLPLFLVAFLRLLLCCHGGATSFLLGVYGPYRCVRDGLSYLGLPATLVVPLLDNHLPPTLFLVMNATNYTNRVGGEKAPSFPHFAKTSRRPYSVSRESAPWLQLDRSSFHTTQQAWGPVRKQPPGHVI
jgi:hypothetical protein